MNNSYSSPEKYLERWITPSLQQASRDHAVVVLTGARQVGKSTLLLNAEPFRDWRYHSMDEFDVLDQARRDPEALWAGIDRVILDEVQKAPDLLVAVKRAVDRNPGKYRFVLSGSTNLLLMKQVSESLAGRAVYFILDPMALGEIHQTKPPDILTRLLAGEFPAESSLDQPSDPDEILMRGLMPALLTLESPQSWTRWWDGYVATYLGTRSSPGGADRCSARFPENDGAGRLAIRPTAEPIRSGAGCPANPTDSPSIFEPARNDEPVRTLASLYSQSYNPAAQIPKSLPE